MNKTINVQFSRNNIEFFRELRKRVKEYFEKNGISKYGNASIITKSILMASLYFIPYILMLTGIVNSFWAIALSWAIMGSGMAGLGLVLMHDANHGTFSRNQKVNQWLGKSIYLLGGFPPNWRFQHNILHHGFTNIEGHDEDIDPAGILRFSPHKPLHKIHRYQHWYAWFFYSIMTLFWATYKDFKGYFKYKKLKKEMKTGKSDRAYLADLIAAKLAYYTIFLVLPIILLPVAWYWTVLFFILMHLVCGLILSSIFQTAHVMPTSEYPVPNEDGNVENNWAIHQLLTTTDYSHKSRIFSWLIGGLNYQVVHHLFPDISHVHYRKLAPIVMETASKYNLPYYVQDNFYSALRSHVKMLKRLGR